MVWERKHHYLRTVSSGKCPQCLRSSVLRQELISVKERGQKKLKGMKTYTMLIIAVSSSEQSRLLGTGKAGE